MVQLGRQLRFEVVRLGHARGGMQADIYGSCSRLCRFPLYSMCDLHYAHSASVTVMIGPAWCPTSCGSDLRPSKQGTSPHRSAQLVTYDRVPGVRPVVQRTIEGPSTQLEELHPAVDVTARLAG
jgi:hypothetical protein